MSRSRNRGTEGGGSSLGRGGRGNLSNLLNLNRGRQGGNRGSALSNNRRGVGPNGIRRGSGEIARRGDLPRPRFGERFRSGDLDRLTKTGFGRRLNLGRQFALAHQRGDFANRLGFHNNLRNLGGWRHRRYRGLVSNRFANSHFSFWYSGPFWGPSYAWTPFWRPWVNWSWWNYCNPIYDPRPVICRPHIYDPCPSWVAWDYPAWQPLYSTVSGTWVDTPTVTVEAGNEVQLLAVRFVDPGHPEKQLGTRYRVWIRNNGDAAISTPFNVVLLASNELEPSEGLPESGVRVESIAAGEVQPIDIRLPFEANRMQTDDQDRKIPFKYLHVLVDSHRELNDVTPDNNGAVIERDQILAVDPAAFSADSELASIGGMLSIAGEGFGPEPGQVLVTVQGLELQATIHGWYDLGVYFEVPQLPLVTESQAELIVVRGDGAASNPIQIKLTPEPEEFEPPVAPDPQPQPPAQPQP